MKLYKFVCHIYDGVMHKKTCSAVIMIGLHTNCLKANLAHKLKGRQVGASARRKFYGALP
jgi:hypothetical protein